MEMRQGPFYDELVSAAMFETCRTVSILIKYPEGSNYLMRKNLTLVLAFTTMIAASAAVTSYNGSGGDMHIMGASGASATTAAGPNGTQYYVEIAESGQQSEITNESVDRTDRTERSVNFTGVIESPTPCHTVSHDVTKEDGEMEIDVSMESSNRTCTQQVVMKEYDGYAEADGLEQVTVSHRGEQMAVFDTLEANSSEESSEESSSTPLDVIIEILTGFL